jgi:hypothetical protein
MASGCASGIDYLMSAGDALINRWMHSRSYRIQFTVRTRCGACDASLQSALQMTALHCVH